MSEEGAPPNKKKRQQPNKKWTERDVMLIIDYLQKEADYEAPTAQIFYKKFLEKSKVDATWDLVRWKVRHLKSQFNKANDWLDAARANDFEEQIDYKSIEAKVLKICPHYSQLKSIFGKRADTSIDPLILISDRFSNDSLSTQLPSAIPTSPLAETSFELDPTFSAPVLEESSSAQTPRASRVSPQKSAIGLLASIEKERIALEKQKMKFQQQRFYKDKEIEERKLLIQEKKLELQVRKQENEEMWRQEEIDLKRLKLEMKERISKYEIDKKYK